MSINNNKELNKKIYHISLYVFLLFLLIFNIFVFLNYTSSNEALLTDYQSPTDKLKWFRKPVTMLILQDINNKGKIVILPDNIVEHPFLKNPASIFSGYEKIIVLKNSKMTNKHLEYVKKFANNVSQSTELPDSIIKNNVLVVHFDDIDNLLADFDIIKTFAKKHGLHPKTYDLADISQIRNIVAESSVKKQFSLEEQHQNLENFVKDFSTELKMLTAHKESKEKYPNNFYDKASVLVLACNDIYDCKEYADFEFKRSLIKSLKRTLHIVKKDNYQTKKVFLLTKLEKQKFENEDELLNSLDTSTGVFIKRGEISAIMLPFFWGKYKNKQDFINQLKIKSGLTPDYFSNNLNIYYFKTVEIPYEDKWL